MKIIDATKAIESIGEIVCSMSVCINSDYCHGMRAMKDMALHTLEEQPTVDAVQVVRCGECKYYGDEYGSCGRTDIIRSDMRIIMPYWYCADGERKEQTDATN